MTEASARAQLATSADVPVVVLSSKPPTLTAALRRAVGAPDLLWSLVRRDLRTKYRRSIIGWGWSMVNPIITTLVYMFVFAVIFKTTPAPGHPSGNHAFAVFLLAGLLPWAMLSNGVTQAIAALVGAGSMMSKVNFPREHIVAGTVFAVAVSSAVELGVLALFDAAIGHAVFQLLPVVLVLLVLQAFFALGLALWLAALNIRYRDVQHLVGVLFLLWFYMTPIIYAPTRVPVNGTLRGHSLPLRRMLMVNPMARFVEAFRRCFYDGAAPSWRVLAYLLASSVTVFLIGYRFFVRRAPRFIEDL